MEEHIIESLRIRHPYLYYNKIDIKPIGLDEYRIKLQNGRRVIFGYTDDEVYGLDQSINKEAARDQELIRRLKRMIIFNYLSIRNAAEQINVPYNTFTRYLRGERSIPLRVIVKLAKNCDTSLDQLLDMDYLFD